MRTLRDVAAWVGWVILIAAFIICAVGVLNGAESVTVLKVTGP